MARKLSGVARQQLLIGFPLAVAAGLHSALTAPAEEIVRAFDQPAVIQNPFARPQVGNRLPTLTPTATATPSNRSAAVPRAAEPAGPAITREAATGGAPSARVAMVPAVSPRIHTNPFARQAPAAPPLEIPMLPGAISRWRHSVRPSGDASKLDGAFVADETKTVGAPADDSRRENSNIPWDRLPPAELLRARHADSLPAAQRRAHTRPEPISFSGAELHQPQWMVPDIQKTASATKDAVPRGDRPAGFDPFESPKRDATAGAEEPALVAAPNSDGAEIVSAGPAPIEPDMTSVVVSEYVDSAEGWQARAQQAAQVAQTSDDLSAVIQDCQRAIQAGAEVEIATRVNRLAAWAYNRRGELAVEDGLEQKALGDFQSALELDPECWLALHNRGVTLAQQRDLGAALLDFNRVIALNPGLAVAYRNRAELLAALGRMEDALGDYDTAIEQLPDDAGLYLGRAYALHRLGDFDRALVDLNRAIELAEHLPEAYTQRGNLHAERGEFPAAIKDLETALQLDPTFVEAHRSAAWLLATCLDGAFRDQAQALAAAQQALALGPSDDPILLETLAAAHANAGQFEEAARVQQRAIEAAPQEIGALLEDRLLLYQQGKAFRSGSSSAVQTASHEEQSRGATTEGAR